MGFAVDTVAYMKRNKTNLSYLSCTIIRFLREKSQKRKKVQILVTRLDINWMLIRHFKDS